MGLSGLRMADGLVTLADEVNCEGCFTFCKEGFWFWGRGQRRAQVTYCV